MFVYLLYVKKIKLRSFNISEHINEKGDGPYRSFGYLSLFSDPIDLAIWIKDNYYNFACFNRMVNTKTSKNPYGTKYIKALVRK